MPKHIKESENSLFRNYWNKTKCIYNYTIEKYKKKMDYLKKKKKKSMAITVEISPTITNIAKKMNPKIHMLKLPKGKKS